MCAAKELQLLGVRFEAEYLEALRHTAAAGKRRRAVVTQNEGVGSEGEWNHGFAYNAGYTEAGFPFGVTWEEFHALNDGKEGATEHEPSDH